jgi:hypothetical protein
MVKTGEVERVKIKQLGDFTFGLQHFASRFAVALDERHLVAAYVAVEAAFDKKQALRCVTHETTYVLGNKYLLAFG